MDGYEIEAQCSIIGIWCHLRMLLSPLMWLNIVKICMPVIWQVYLTPLKNYFYFASGIDLWTDCQLITFHALRFQHAPELSKEVGCKGKWDGSISPTGLENPFTLMSVSSSVNNQGLVHWNGVGSYSMKIPKSMDQENVLFWIGQRWLICITQEGCSGLSHIWRRLLMRKTQQGFIATLYRCFISHHMHHHFMQWEAYESRGYVYRNAPSFSEANDFLSSASWLHSSWTNALNIKHYYKGIHRCSRLISMFLICGRCGLTWTLAIPHSHW